MSSYLLNASISRAATPGVKKPFEDASMDVVINEDVTTTSLAAATIRVSRVSFSEVVQRISVPAYSGQYPVHPREFVFD